MVLETVAPEARIINFFPYGYDERQFCSPGFDLPVGLFQRSQFGTYPEYHTSADNLDFIRPKHLGESYDWLLRVIDVLEKDRTLINLLPKGEPQLGRRGMYSAFGSGAAAMQKNLAVLWVLNMSDGQHSLLDIALRAEMPFEDVVEAALELEQRGLVATAGP
jgi:aminopeptidase-like protein